MRVVHNNIAPIATLLGWPAGAGRLGRCALASSRARLRARQHKRGSGKPLAVAGTKGGKNLVSLKSYPPSNIIRADFWVGDSVNLLKPRATFLA